MLEIIEEALLHLQEIYETSNFSANFLNFSGTTVSAVASIIAALVAILSFIYNIYTYVKQWRKEKLFRNDFGTELYDEYTINNALRYYVKPFCSSVDPSYEADFRQLILTPIDLFKTIDKCLLDEKHPKRHILLLSGSGMGKTSFALNYYAYNKQKKGEPQRLVVIPLSIISADEKIQEIEDKKDTIIFLDAFDEDIKARKDHKQRIFDLMKKCNEFKRVLITCRTQFFLKDEEIPPETGIVQIGPQKMGDSGRGKFYKLYILPFDTKQIDQFTNKRFSVFNNKKRKKIKEIIEKVKPITIRPMILAYIFDSLDCDINFNVKYGFQLYEKIIDAWLERERKIVKDKDKEALRSFSERLAIDLFTKANERYWERIPYEDTLKMARMWNIPLKTWHITGRSLLNRDVQGNYKFAHRSIMEYLFVKRFINLGMKSRYEAHWFSCPWTDLMKEFLVDMIKNDKKSSSELMLVDLSNTNLEKLDLSEINLKGANFNGAILKNTNLSKANLSETNFNGTELTGVNLSKAKLTGANLENSILDHTNCKDSLMINVCFDTEKKYLSKYNNVPIFSVSFNPTGDILASGNKDNTICLWKMGMNKCTKILKGHENFVYCVAFHPNRNILASGSSDNTVRLWDIDTGECTNILEGHKNSIKSVSFNFNGSTLASGGWDNTIRLWDVNTGECTNILEGHKDLINSISFHPDGSVLASGSNDNTIRLWNLDTGEKNQIWGYQDSFWDVSFHPEGHILAGGSSDKTVHLFEVNEELEFKLYDKLKGHEDWVSCVSFNPDGSVLASGSKDNKIRLWNTKTSECIHTFEGHEDLIQSLSFNSNNTLMASGGSDSKIYLWNLKDSHNDNFSCRSMNIEGVKGLSGSQVDYLKKGGAQGNTSNNSGFMENLIFEDSF